MCHAQPGTRCQPHLNQKLENSRQALLKAINENGSAYKAAKLEGRVGERENTLRRLSVDVHKKMGIYNALKDEFYESKDGLRELRGKMSSRSEGEMVSGSEELEREREAGAYASFLMKSSSRKLVDRAHRVVNSSEGSTVYDDGNGEHMKAGAFNGRYYRYATRGKSVAVNERAETILDDEEGKRHKVYSINNLEYGAGLPKTNKILERGEYISSTDEGDHQVNAYVSVAEDNPTCRVDRTAVPDATRRVYDLEVDYKADDFQSNDKSGVRVLNWVPSATPEEKLVVKNSLEEAGFSHVVFVPENI